MKNYLERCWLCDANLSLFSLCCYFAASSFPLPLTSCDIHHLASFHMKSPFFPKHMSRTPRLFPSIHPSRLQHLSSLQYYLTSLYIQQSFSSISSLSFRYCFHLSFPSSLLLLLSFLYTNSFGTSSSPVSS